MNYLPKRAVLLSALILPFTFGAATSQAAQITEWAYDVTNSFNNVSFTEGEGVANQTDNVLSWGSEEVQSSISIEPSISSPPNLITNGDRVPGGTFEHDNQIIPAGTTQLDSFELTSTLSVEAVAPESMAGETAGPIAVGFQSFFTETFNGGDCFAGSESTCDDIFSLENPEFGELNEAGNFEFASDPFTIDDFNYTVFLEIVGLNELTDEQCSIAGASATCIGFLTQEQQNNTFASNFRVTSSPVAVPEPGTLGLLGLGLLGLGLASRRKKGLVSA